MSCFHVHMHKCALIMFPLCYIGDDSPLPNQVAPTSSDAKEVELYISMPQVDFNALRDEEVLGWWRTHQSMFPHLSRMARQFLSLPASSAGDERLFSRSGEMHGNKRKRLKEETLQSLLYVNKNA